MISNDKIEKLEQELREKDNIIIANIIRIEKEFL